MGYVAAIGSLVSAGIGLAGDLSKGGAGAGIGAAGGTLQHAAANFVDPFAYNQQYWNLDMPGMAGESINYGITNAPQINQANMQQLQALLNTALPGYQSAVNQIQTNASSLLQGQIPADVQSQVQRFGAQSTLTSGIGAGGGAGAGAGAGFNLTNKTITARDLGLTSLNLQQTGATEESNLLQLTKNYLTPQQVNPMSILPLGDLIQGRQWQDTAFYNANTAAYTAASGFAQTQAGQPPTPGLGGTGGDLTAIIQALTKNQPQGGSQSGTNLLSQLFGSFGGGGGGGGGTPDLNTDAGAAAYVGL